MDSSTTKGLRGHDCTWTASTPRNGEHDQRVPRGRMLPPMLLSCFETPLAIYIYIHMYNYIYIYMYIYIYIYLAQTMVKPLTRHLNAILGAPSGMFRFDKLEFSQVTCLKPKIFNVSNHIRWHGKHFYSIRIAQQSITDSPSVASPRPLTSPHVDW